MEPQCVRRTSDQLRRLTGSEAATGPWECRIRRSSGYPESRVFPVACQRGGERTETRSDGATCGNALRAKLGDDRVVAKVCCSEPDRNHEVCAQPRLQRVGLARDECGGALPDAGEVLLRH